MPDYKQQLMTYFLPFLKVGNNIQAYKNILNILFCFYDQARINMFYPKIGENHSFNLSDNAFTPSFFVPEKAST